MRAAGAVSGGASRRQRHREPDRRRTGRDERGRRPSWAWAWGPCAHAGRAASAGVPVASSSPRRAPGRRRAGGTRTPPRRDCEVWGKNETAVCVASLGASDAVWRASGSSYTAPLERLFGAGAGLVGLGVYAGAARCRADALGGEVPSGAAAACCVLRGAGAAITLLYGVSDGIHDEQKARLA